MSQYLPHLISFEQFANVEMRVGTVVEAVLNSKARKPAYVLTIDFGSLGTKISSAQLVDNYTLAEIIGCQVVAVMNLAPRRVAGVKSEVLVLAAVCSEKGTVLVQPQMPVTAGTRLA